MANKMFYYAIILAVNLILVATEECKCTEDKTTKEVEELWSFLAPEQGEENGLYPVPGELSPIAPCGNCIENNRKKRKIEEVKEDTKEVRRERSPKAFRRWRHANDERNKCPIGYRRMAFMCVPVKH